MIHPPNKETDRQRDRQTAVKTVSAPELQNMHTLKTDVVPKGLEVSMSRDLWPAALYNLGIKADKLKIYYITFGSGG